MKRFILLLILFVVCTVLVSAQRPSKPLTYTLHGTIKNTTGAVMGGLRLIKNDESTSYKTFTDINGDFKLDLTPGDYVLTVDPFGLYGFRAFIKITENGPNPDNVEFTVDTSRICCVTATGEPFPKPTSLPKRAFPPAAMATRSFSEVIVSVKIDHDGKITSAKAENGHPLLRAAAEGAARSSRFESSDVKERSAMITYLFVDGEVPLKDGRKRYLNQYTVDRLAEHSYF